MIEQRKLVLAALSIVLLSIGTAAIAQESTWSYPPVSMQLEMDATLIPVGKGAIFCPAMTDPGREPFYGVIRDGQRVGDAEMGRRITLDPGIYTVVIGSGAVNQLIRKTVRVDEGATTVLHPDWSGLVIEVTNQSRTPVREYYEVYNIDTLDSYGIGQGADVELDEQPLTWLLPPGRYKIVKPGENVTTVSNFGTIRLLPGELARTNLAVETQTGDFLGFGYQVVLSDESRETGTWEMQNELSGNILLNYNPTSETATESEASFTSTIQWLTDARFESGNHSIPIWSNIEEGLSMEDDRVLRKYIDRAEIRLTYIYRFSDIASPYIRTTAETRLFPTYQRFGKPTDFAEMNADGDTLRIVRGAEEVKLGGAFSPIYLKQGFGLTSILMRSLPVNLNLRTGYGFRWTLTRGAHIYNTDRKQLIELIRTETSGLEMLLLGDFRIGRYISFSNDFDILIPEANRDTWIYDGENRLRINLSSHVSVLFTMEYWKDENVRETQYRYQTLLRFSTFL